MFIVEKVQLITKDVFPIRCAQGYRGPTRADALGLYSCVDILIFTFNPPMVRGHLYNIFHYLSWALCTPSFRVYTAFIIFESP